LHCCAHRCGDSDGVGIVASSAFNPITWREERVKSLDKLRITGKQLTDSSNHAGGIDSSTLEILHDIKEAVVDIRVIRKLNFNLVQIAQSVVQNGLLALCLALGSLTLAHLLLLCGLRLALSKRHKQRRVTLVLSLGRLDRSAAEHAIRSSWAAHGKLPLWLRSSQAWISKQAIWSMNSTRSYSHGLVQVHGLTLGLMLRRLFQSLTFLLAMLPVLLFFDVDLLDFTSSLAICSGGLASRLAQSWEREIWALLALRSVC
jgi:hypothetical protein